MAFFARSETSAMAQNPSSNPKPRSRRSRPLQVAEEIKDWVVERGLQPGDRLPGEAEMIARFGMSKGTIREAMRLLQAQGLIETKTGPGGGSFVGEVTRERATALLGNYFYSRDVTIDDIYQVRIALEPLLASSLAGRLSDAQLVELEEIIKAAHTGKIGDGKIFVTPVEQAIRIRTSESGRDAL